MWDGKSCAFVEAIERINKCAENILNSRVIHQDNDHNLTGKQFIKLLMLKATGHLW